MNRIFKILPLLLFTSLILSFTGCSFGGEAHYHTFSSEWKSDAINHWHEATCEHKDQISDLEEHIFLEWTITKKATAEEEGLYTRSCKVCGAKETMVIPKLNVYTFESAWTSDEYYHWHKAEGDGNENIRGSLAEHTYGDWEVDSPATCLETGLKHRSCTGCGYRNEIVINKTPHPWETTGTTERAPSALKPGKVKYSCTETGCTDVKYEYPPRLFCDSPVAADETTEYTDMTSENPATKTDSYVYFGDFPQTVVIQSDDGAHFYEDAAKTKEFTIDETTPVATRGNMNIYAGSNGELYVKSEIHAYHSDARFSDNSIAYYANTQKYRYFRVEPVKWAVKANDYDVDGGTTTASLLVATKLLMSDVYYLEAPNSANTVRREVAGTTLEHNDYEKSELRAYLNGLDFYVFSIKAEDVGHETKLITKHNGNGFLQHAFSDTAKGNIVQPILAETGTTAVDYLFTLSSAETETYFPDTTDRAWEATDYAIGNRYDTRETTGYWWTRTAVTTGDLNYQAKLVSPDGSIIEKYVAYNIVGVLPALVYDLPDSNPNP